MPTTATGATIAAQASGAATTVATTTSTALPAGGIIGGTFSIAQLANFAIALAIIAAGALSVVYIFIGGISFILSGGQEDKIKQAVHTIRYAIIGLLVSIFAVTMIGILGQIFGFNLLSYISWNEISAMMRGILTKMSQTGLPNQ